MLQHFHWGSVSLINIPVMTILLAISPFLLPEYCNDDASRIELLSVGLSLITALPIVDARAQINGRALAQRHRSSDAR